MKKIEQRMCKAMLYKESFKTGNTEVEYVPYENKSFAYLWGSCVGTLHHETRELTVSSCGYSTVTTKSRINAMLSYFNTGAKVHQKNFEWYINDEEFTYARTFPI